MTTDLVERLREARCWHNDDMREAADEIERLRAALDGLHVNLDGSIAALRMNNNEIERLREALQRIVTLCSDDHDRAGIADIARGALRHD